MRFVVMSCFVAATLHAAGLASSPATPLHDDPGGGVTLTVRGCVSGSLLKGVSADGDPGAPGLAPSERYRMIGSKQVKAQIKKANKALVTVTGRVQPGPQAVTKGGRVGGTAIGIGVTTGPGSLDQPQAPYTPTIEVDSIDVIAKTCDG